MSEKHQSHPHGHAAGPEDKKADQTAHCEAHKERFDHACKVVANGIGTLKAAGCTQAEANALAVQLWEKTKAG